MRQRRRPADPSVRCNWTSPGGDAIAGKAAKVRGTSLDTGVELDALAKLPEPERAELIDRAAPSAFPSVAKIKHLC
ncbi:MAG TPA: hypothetical protein VF478_06270 [Anaerolineae bacterium]